MSCHPTHGKYYKDCRQLFDKKRISHFTNGLPTFTFRPLQYFTNLKHFTNFKLPQRRCFILETLWKQVFWQAGQEKTKSRFKKTKDGLEKTIGHGPAVA